jgi:hypothetical protein
MTDITVILANTVNIQENTKTTIDYVGDTLSTIADISGVIGLPSAIVGLVALIANKPSPTERALTHIAATMDAALHFQVVNAELEKMYQVNAVLGPAETNWKTWLDHGGDFSNELINIATFEQNSRLAVSDFSNDDTYWLRPFYDGLIYDSGWLGRLTPPADSMRPVGPGLFLVFDYRLTLPAFVTAAQIRCGYILAMRGLRPATETVASYQKFLSEEMPQMIGRLEAVHDRVLSGLTSTRLPANTADDLKSYERNGAPIGVVDIYSTMHIIRIWIRPQEVLDDNGNLVPMSSDQYSAFSRRLPITNKLFLIQLYDQLGLAGAWRGLQSLDRIAGRERRRIDPRVGWSLRDLNALLNGVPVTNGFKLGGVLATLKQLATTLIPVGDPPPPTSSLRTALKDAALPTVTVPAS